MIIIIIIILYFVLLLLKSFFIIDLSPYLHPTYHVSYQFHLHFIIIAMTIFPFITIAISKYLHFRRYMGRTKGFIVANKFNAQRLLCYLQGGSFRHSKLIGVDCQFWTMCSYLWYCYYCSLTYYHCYHNDAISTILSP